LNRDHEMAQLLESLHLQSQQLLQIYNTQSEGRQKEIQNISTGDSFDTFSKQVREIRDYHRRYPNQPAENLEIAYKKGVAPEGMPLMVDRMFSGEEFFGRYFDMYNLHEQYLNLPTLKNARRITYIQYLDSFDNFTSISRKDKLSDAYWLYVRNLANYLENFMKLTKPLENLDRLLAQFEEEFEKLWTAGEVPGWEDEVVTLGNDSPTWCADCEKEFGNENVFKHHFTSKKHIKNVERKKKEANGQAASNGTGGTSDRAHLLREKAIAEREFRVKKLVAAMQTQRSDTRDNVERKAAMTEREREQELEALYQDGGAAEPEEDDDEDDNEKIYNPLKLPLDWSGKPIPFWLYKLHGLGVEFDCEICGNFTYMGRRAFDKHFNEARHVYGLKCLGITNSALFREITKIEEAQKLWGKIMKNKRTEKNQTENVVQMEDGEGNVMPEKVFRDLQKQGLI